MTSGVIDRLRSLPIRSSAVLLGHVTAGVACNALATAFGVIAKNVEPAGLFGFVMLFVPYLSSASDPTHTMPSFLRGLAEHQPITPVIDTLRGLLTGAPVDRGRPAVIWTAAVLVIAFAGATGLCRVRTRR